MKIIGIYQIQSKCKPERIYIGSSKNIGFRWSHHLYDLRKQRHGSKKLQNHYNKYGESDLIFTILLACDKEFLITNEQFFIDSYCPYFNGRKTAANYLGINYKNRISPNKGKKASEETRRRMSEHNGMRGISPPNKGKHHSIEICKKLSESHKGKPSPNKGKKWTPEAKRKKSESQIGINNHFFGKHHSEETKQKIRESKKGRPFRNFEFQS